jgi:hypothetical protein
MAGKGRPKNRSKAEPLTVTLPGEAFEYFVLLASLGKLGSTENDVAAYILVREYQKMEADKFHERRLPKPPQSVTD